MSSSCRNCGTALAGPYCTACGQAEEDGHATTVSLLVREALQEISDVDGKVLRTVVALFTRPGRLTGEYWEGRRASWVRPLRIFLLAAALHFVAVPGIGPMNFEILLQRTPNGSLDVSVGTAARRRAGQGGLVEVSESERLAYLERLRDTYSTTRYFAPLVFAMGTWFVYRRRQPFLASHIVMAGHFYAFWYLVSVVTSRLPFSVAGGWIGVALSASYLFLMLRTLFDDRVGPALAKTTVLYLAMVVLEMGMALAVSLWVARAS
ncbi:MAG: DUF3667 domain-containing protein [Vicinamibacterales bacterium]